MTAAARFKPWMSPEAYLAWEAEQDERYEYIDGEVFAMAGASPNHGRIAGDIFGSLRNQLRGKKCEAFMETMKVKVPPLYANVYFYPDVVVLCEPADPTRNFLENPTAIFEVLSPSTEHKNHSEKTPAYMHLASLQFYAVISQQERLLTVRRRTATGWEMQEFTQPEDVVRIDAIGCELKLAEIYERVVWDARPSVS